MIVHRCAMQKPYTDQIHVHVIGGAERSERGRERECDRETKRMRECQKKRCMGRTEET